MRKKDDRNKETTGLGSAIKQMIEEYRLEGNFNKADLVSRWPEIAGPMIASRTRRLFIKKDTLYIEVDSAPLKNELHLSREAWLKKLKEEMGELPIKEIKVL